MAPRSPSPLHKVSLLHRSSMSEVYLVRRDEQMLVAKFPRDQSVSGRLRVKREYEFLQRLDSPLIVRSVGLVDEPLNCALLLDWDESLKPLTQFEPLSLEQWLRAAAGAARSLEMVHAAGLIHRDVKPSNFLASDDLHRVVLIDFSHCVAQGQSADLLAPDGLVGSPAYMAPEQTGRLGVGADDRADLYSLGVCLFELLAGTHPFPGSDLLSLAHAHIAKDPPAVTSPSFSVPQVVEAIVARLLAKSPDARYQTARALGADLQRCSQEFNGHTIGTFALGRDDLRREFHVPEALYGRKEEIDVLLAAYRDASEGHRRVVFVGGDSGVGKTKLIATVRRFAYGATFVTGKADQFERSHSFSAVAAAIGEWADALSSAHEHNVERWRARLDDAVGANGQLVAEQVPKLSWVLGEREPVREISIEQAETRLLEVMLRVVKSLASGDSPLVLFLDDLQWSDTATLALLRRLVVDAERQRLLVLCAYRKQHVQLDHPLHRLLSDVGDDPCVTALDVGPISRKHVGAFVKDALGCSECSALADYAHARTQGNPFHLAQLLTSFHDAGVIRLDPETSEWRWDEDRARGLPPHDDVVDLLLTRLSRLPESSREILAVAAVLRTTFDVATLATASGRDPLAVGKELQPVLDGGFIRPTSVSFDQAKHLLGSKEAPSVELSFSHDRIQEVAKRLLGAKEAPIRSALGIEMITNLPKAELDARLFEVLDHCTFIAEPLDRPLATRAARLAEQAARKARDSGAVDAAITYCSHGRRLLGEHRWSECPELTFELTTLQAQCQFVAGNRQGAQDLLAEARAQGPNARQRAAILTIEGLALMAADDVECALDKYAEALTCLGQPIKRKPSTAATIAEFARLKWALRGWTLDKFRRLPPMTDPQALHQAVVLKHAMPAAFMSGAKRLYATLACCVVRLTLRYGADPQCASAFSALGVTHLAAIGDAVTAEFLGKIGLTLAGSDPAANCETKLLYGAFISSWRPMSESDRAQMLLEGHRSGVEGGTAEEASYCLSQLAVHTYRTDPSLARHLEQCEASVVAMERAAVKSRGARYLLRRARGVAGQEPILTAEEFARDVEDSSPGTTALIATLALDIGLSFDSDELREYGFEVGLASAGAFRGTRLEILQTLLSGLHACRIDPKDARHRRYRRFARKAVAKLGRWTKQCPEVFAWMHHRLLGELALSRGDPEAAIRSLRRALELIYEVPQKRAEILEAMARAHRAAGDLHHASALLSQACEAYRIWGAFGIVDHLIARYAPSEHASTEPSRAPEHTITTSLVDSSLDLEAVFKSAQALSGEVVLSSLLEKMVRTVLESTGGQRAAVLEPTESGWDLAVWGEVGADEVSVGLGAPDPQTIPMSVLASASRLQEPVQVTQATTHEIWSKDPAVEHQGIVSILCVPVVRQRQLVAVVYVDHLSVEHCFPVSRSRLLLMLASQISISLENARLYATLENKVEERTEALREVSQDLHTILDHVRFGFLVVGRDLTIRPGFSRSCETLLATTDIAGREVSAALGATDPRQAYAIEFSCEQIFEDMLPLELYQDQFPGRLIRGERVLRVEPSVVRNEGEVAGILLTIADATELEVAQKQNTINRVLLNLLRRKDSFVLFLRDTLTLLDEAKDAARQQDPDRLARCLHNLKGAVGLFGLFDVEQFIHALESKAQLDVADVLAIQHALEAFLNQHRDVLGLDLDAANNRSITVPQHTLDQLDHLASRLDHTHATELRGWAAHARSPTVGDVLGPLVQSMTELATQLQKQVGIAVHGADARIESPGAQAILRSLVLLVRNSIDHGIEKPSQRGDKPIRAKIELRVLVSDEHYEFVVEDDGRGIDVDAVTKKALSAGAITAAELEQMTAQERLQLIFVAKVSTAKELTTVSGRGVGMSALKHKIVTMGGNLQVESRSGHGTTMTIRLPRGQAALRAA